MNMILLTATLIFITVGVGYLAFYKNTAKTENKRDEEHDKTVEEVTVVEPDHPIPFGYKTVWLAIKTEDTQFVADVLRLKNLKAENWSGGLNQVYKNHDHAVFVAPPVAGWTLVIGFPLGSFGPEESDINDKFLNFLTSIGKKIPDFYCFGTHRVSDYNSWVIIKDGSIERAYGSCGAETCVNIGEKTTAEIELGLNFFDASSKEAEEDENYYDRKDLRFPDEEDVINISSKWTTINTMELDQYPASTSLGILGEMK